MKGHGRNEAWDIASSMAMSHAQSIYLGSTAAIDRSIDSFGRSYRSIRSIAIDRGGRSIDRNPIDPRPPIPTIALEWEGWHLDHHQKKERKREKRKGKKKEQLTQDGVAISPLFSSDSGVLWPLTGGTWS